MERAVALKRLGKLLGKSLGYRVDPKALNAEQRGEARIAHNLVAAETETLRSKLEARRKAILDADAEYKSLHEAWIVAKQRAEKLQGKFFHYRFTVGTNNGMFFHIRAQGDSWEEVIAKIENRK